MTDNDEADSPDNTGGADGTPKSHAPKDRQCPFCHIPFTSSSLGRHLDLYIKEKNPKPPDGVHDVDKIRQIRGKITRRHPKGYAAARDQAARGESDGGARGPLRAGVRESEGYNSIANSSPFADTINDMSNIFNPTSHAHGGLFALGRMNWQSTGVINETPGRANGNTPVAKDTGEGKLWPAPEPINQNASTAEIALYDVVKNIQRAAVRLQRPGPFDFDLFALNFPGMCLKLLPPPPTLFSTTPSHSNTSWPIDPPGSHHLDVVKAAIRRRLKAYTQVCPPLGSRLCNTKEELEQHLSNVVDEEFVRYEEHTNCTHGQWTELSDDQRQQVWHLEVLRAYSKLITESSDLTSRVEKAQDTIAELKMENEKLRLMRASEGAFGRPGQSSFVSQKLLREVSDNDADPASWAFHAVLDRYKDWTPGSKENRTRSGGANGMRSEFGASDEGAGAQGRASERMAQGGGDVEMGEDGPARG